MQFKNTAALRRMAKGFAKIERYMHGQEPGIFELVIKWCETFLVSFYAKRLKVKQNFFLDDYIQIFFFRFIVL